MLFNRGDTVTTEEHMQALAGRLSRLEAAQAVRNTLARYMALCDQPCGDRAFPQLADLFDEDAVWEGMGRSAAMFGRHQGRPAIAAFVQSYLAPSAHFTRNLHFITSDQVHVSGDGTSARGQWLMLQLSSYGEGGAQAISARLEIDFRPAADGRWQIVHFRTERLDCVPWHDSGAAAATGATA
jgi:ketosteroid isomerase-like protein